MKIQILAIGKLKKGAQSALMEEYLKRLKGWKVQIQQINEAKAATSAQRKQLDAKNILSYLTKDAFIIALDERGIDLNSMEFAQMLQDAQQRFYSQVMIIIGGSDGLHEDIRKRCHKIVAFGRLTWPHQLVRILLCEQIYRAQTIINNHPYHKA